MKPILSEPDASGGKRLLILTDGKPGHVNQSIAFARHLGFTYDLLPVSFKTRGMKALSYLADRFGLYRSSLFYAEHRAADYVAVVSSGSGTYYANRTLALQLGCKSVAIMLPRGYRLNFDLIIAQQHDDPPEKSNIISVPINLTYVDPQRIVLPREGQKYISIIIGGNSSHGQLDAGRLRMEISRVLALFPEHKVWLTTSRRTPEAVEKMLHQFKFERAVYYSQEPINPIPDFLAHSEYVFLTADSSSMISEAVSYGDSCVEVLHAAATLPKDGKFSRLIKALSELDCLHLFDGSCADCNRKIDLQNIFNQQIVQQVKLKSL